ncbi:unnamed protein product [Rotaria sordida]|uniref:Uncharacterized protein n=1 Tax=Rotaria sordida TaxID=392033 RepID=A0A815CT87_9BILA|nr:unnamed protein product [Rotaria sordida]CAF1564805.1 unnamed protein product [Rotaria sordida]
MNTSALSNKGTLTKSAIGKIEAKKETHSSKAQKKTATPTFTNIVNIEISSTVKKTSDNETNVPVKKGRC